MKTKMSLAVSFALLSTGVLSGCDDDNALTAPAESQQEAPQTVSASMLKYIPADSPYFMASRDVMTEEEAFAMYQRMQPKGSLESDLNELRDMLADIDDDVQRSLMTFFIAMGEELAGIETLDEIHALGLKVSPQAALYGLGILPVMRMELEDGDAFRETLQRALAKADITLGTATTNGIEYSVLTPEGPIKAIMVIDDQQLLMSVVPQHASDELLSLVLGKTLPDNSLNDTGALTELEARHGFTPYFAGRVDSSRLLGELSTPMHSGTQALMEAVDAEPLELSTCQADIDRITNRIPGLVMGMREYSRDRMEMNLILETDEGIVSDLRAMTAQVPGLGSSEGVASFGLGLNLPVLMQTVQKYAQQVRQNPFSCDELQALNTTWNDVTMALSNPMAMMIAPTLSGVNGRINRLVMKNGQPTGAAILTLASQNPLSLLSTASTFIPGLEALKLEPGGETRKVESMLLPPEFPTLYAAMSDTAIALGAGISHPKVLQTELESPVLERDLLLHGHLSGEFYHSLAGIMEQMPANAMADFDLDQFKAYGDMYENMEYWLRVDDAGVEMSFSLELE